ncbi:radical SAM protein [Bradyrhizobium cenepequi]|uniref:radical SAM protein n=1 Tax=Bradyrhizobium cenepequi TaxID=2821403 RepID=UPI001CE26821|nr:radical SAM protein [Bradyrhizobium cenepequi]MCA6112617.1 radical SAM protein [Bradyrhizobium cenepequi]
MSAIRESAWRAGRGAFFCLKANAPDVENPLSCLERDIVPEKPPRSAAIALAQILLRPRAQTQEDAMASDSPLPIIFDHMRISISFYCNLHCDHCYVPEEYRDQYKRLLEPSQLSVEEITNFLDLLVDEHSLRKVTVTGGEPLLKIVFPRSAALMAYANKRGLHVQLNTGGLGQVPIPDVVSIFDEREKLVFQFSFDGANKDTVDRFRRKPGVYESALRQMHEAVNRGALVQARMTANRHNIGEALDAYRLLSSIGVDSFKIRPMFAAGVAIDNEDALLGSAEEIRELQEALIAMAAQTSTRLELPPPIFVDTTEPRPNVKYIECNCGVASGYLSTNGDLYPCVYVVGDPDSHEFLVGNIRSAGFDLETAWRTSPALKKYRANSGCAQCPTQVALLKNVENRALACA